MSDSFFEADMQEVGLFVDHPELEQDQVIKRALEMEDELAIILKKHQDYMEVDGYSLIM